MALQSSSQEKWIAIHWSGNQVFRSHEAEWAKNWKWTRENRHFMWFNDDKDDVDNDVDADKNVMKAREMHE